jgi:hypothetical protein
MNDVAPDEMSTYSNSQTDDGLTLDRSGADNDIGASYDPEAGDDY